MMKVKTYSTYEEMIEKQELEKIAFKQKQQEERKLLKKKIAEDEKKKREKTEKQLVSMLRLSYKGCSDGEILMKLSELAEANGVDEKSIQKVLK